LAGKCSLWFLLAHWLVFVHVSLCSYSPYLVIHSGTDKYLLHLEIFLQKILRQDISISLPIDTFLLYPFTMLPCIPFSVTSLTQRRRSYVHFRTCNVAIKRNHCHARNRLLLNDLIGVQNNF
jgi:hypothetical protein